MASSEPIIIHIKLVFFPVYIASDLPIVLLYAQLLATLRGFYTFSKSCLVTEHNLALANILLNVLFFFFQITYALMSSMGLNTDL